MPKLPLSGAALAVATLLAPGPAAALTVFSESFDDPAFVGSVAYPGNASDRWAHTSYYRAVGAHGWTFSNGDYLAVNDDDPAGRALLLNEGGNSARITIGGLIAGSTYLLSFLQWGDNAAGSGYAGGVLADGASVLSFSGVDLAAGSNAGTLRSGSFVASAPSVTLTFFETSRTDASPIIDDILVTDLPEPASLATFALSLGGVLAAYRSQRRRRSVASATSASGAQ